MQTEQALWRIVTTLIVGGALLTLVVLLWIRIVAHQPAPNSGVYGSAYQNGASAHPSPPRATYDGPMPLMTPLPYEHPLAHAVTPNSLPTLLGP